ncbi:MAG TPA: GNAT family N-acetyltransferase [Bacteroidia bacterium]|nr:GNAT family N-acetyltransferase [Bacteroidia bacterium]
MPKVIKKYNDSYRSTLVELLRSNTPDFFSPSEESDLNYYLDNHTENFYTISLKNKIVGCGGFNLTEDDSTAKIAWDIVHPTCHGQGLGSELLKFRIQKIKEIEKIKTISVRTSQFAYGFYKKFGFQTREIIKDYWAEGFDLYKMDADIKLFKNLI